MRSAIEAFIFHFAPISTDATAAVPSKIEEEAAKMLPTFAKEFRTPAGFGYMNAQFVIKEIESAAQPSGAPHTEWDVPVFFGAHETVLADIGRDLGVGAKKNREK